jgi:hypothetical protein
MKIRAAFSQSGSRPLHFAGIPLVAIAGGLLAACGAGSSGNAGAPTGHPASGVSQPGSAGSGAGTGTGVSDGIGHPVNVRSLLPAAAVASATGEAISQGAEEDTPSYKIYSCNYTNATGTAGLTVSVLALDAVAGYNADYSANVQVVGAAAKQISGLGDKAFSGTGGTEALFGNVQITVANLESETAAVSLIRTLQPKL